MIPDFSTFLDREKFQSRLEELQRAYDYDEQALKAIDAASSHFTDVCSAAQDYLKTKDANQFQEKIKTSIINSEVVDDSLKATTVLVLHAILTKNHCIRTLKQEALRWFGVKYEQLPEKMRK